MGRPRAQLNIEKLIKEGRGQGRGGDYLPWITVQSFSSRGYANRPPGWKTGRGHHLMSNLEAEFFYLLEWSEEVVDIREQFPLLPVAETVAIAKALGFRHPVDLRTKNAFVLTTDFLITLRGSPREIEQARTVKPESELESQRTLEKFEIERQYWRTRNVDWGIVTDTSMPRALVQNILWVYPHFRASDNPVLPENHVAKIDAVLRESLDSGIALAASANACDDKLGLEIGTSLTFARHFIATRRWRVDLKVKIDPSAPLKVWNSSPEMKNGTVHQHAA